jgi:3',5'-cyclic AMP phosphodiesterase CpdA
LAISDLHVAYPENREIVAQLRPESDHDWLVLPGDVGEIFDDVAWVLEQLSDRFARVIWAPGNHELWTMPKDPVQVRGDERYQALVRLCQQFGVLTPEDPYPIWTGPGGPVAIAPLFVLYDYSFRSLPTKEAALAQAHESGVVCNDELVLHPDPFPTLDAWCTERLALTEARLAELPTELPTVLVNHFPLIREPTRILRYPDFALWCGTERTADWHRRFRARAVVYGHLHIPRTVWQDGVPFIEVSLGYPREWKRRAAKPGRLVPVLS